MYPFDWKLPDWAGASHIHKHLIRYLLKKSLGSFIKSDFALDTVDLEITKGQLSLRKLEINTEFINELLIGTPLQVVSGTIECINVTVPWQMVLSDPFHIHLDGLKLWVQLSPSSKPRLEETFKSILEASTLSIANDFLSELQDFPDSEGSPPPKEPETSDHVGGFIDKLVANLKLTLGSLEINIAPKQGPQITLRAETAEILEDVSSTEPIRRLPSFSRRITTDAITIALDGGKTPIVRTDGAFALLVKHTVNSDNSSQLSVQTRVGQLHTAMSPRQVEELDCFLDALTACMGPDETTKERSLLDWSLDLSIEAILFKLLYQNTSQTLFNSRRNLSHLCIDITGLKLKVQNTAPSSPSFYTHSQSLAQPVAMDVDIAKLTIREWLSSAQYPPRQIPKGAFSFARDCYLPVLLSDHNLPNSSLLLEALPLIGHAGAPAGRLGTDTFKGLHTFWRTPHRLNPQSSALVASLSLADACKVQITAAPTWLRVDPRLVDRLEGFLLILKRRSAARKKPSASPHPHAGSNGYNESIIMDDLDSRDSVPATAEWSFNISTDYFRVMIQAPCDITGDDQDLNHRIARVHADCWVLDCLKPWVAMPGPLPCIAGHAKIGYLGLDISLLLGPHSRTLYGFLSVGPSQEDGPTPTLEIGRGTPGRPKIPSRFSSRSNGRFPVPFPPPFDGFSEGEVKTIDPSEQEEEILSFKQSIIDTSMFAIHCSFPRVQLNFTKEAYDATQFLINDLTSWEPRFLKEEPPEVERPASPHGSEESLSFYTARDEGATFRGPSSVYSVDPPPTEKLTLQSLSTLIVSMPLLDIHLDMSPDLPAPKLYSIVFKNCQFFSTSKLHGKSQTYTFIESDDLFLLDSTDSDDPRVIISPTPCNFKNSFQLTSFAKLELPFSTIKETSVAIAFSGLDLRFPLASEPPPLFQHLGEFFSGDAKISTVSSTITRASVTLTFKEISVILLPEAPNHPWLVMLIEKAGMSTTIFAPDSVLHIHAGIGKAQVLLSQKEPDISVHLPFDQKCDPRRSLQSTAFQFWQSHLFVPIGLVDCLSCRVSIHNRDKIPQLDITDEVITLTFCRDSYLLMQQVLLSLSPEDDPETEPREPARDDPKLGVLEKSICYNILDTLEENAYGRKERFVQQPSPEPFASDMEFIDEFFGEDPEDCELNPPSFLTHIPQPRPRKSVSRKDFYRHTRGEYEPRDVESEGDIVRVLDDAPAEIIDDYFALEREPHRPIGRIDLENVRLRMRLQDFNIKVRLFDGQDWQLEASSSPQSSPQDLPAICRVHHQVRLARPPRPSMELLVSQLRIDFSSLLPEHEETFRLVVAANDIEILDHVPTSTWRKFLAPMKSSTGQLPRESQSEMLRIELTQIRPFPTSPSREYRLKFSLLPIRLFVDQDALNFLIDFFLGDAQQDPLEPPEPTHPSTGDDVFFQYVEVGDIEVKLDYKPKHLNLRQLSEGNFAELAKVFQLEDAQMSLDKIRLTGVNGLAKLTDELISHWLPHIKGTQLPHMVSGVGPMRTLSNLGSGVADLVLLPLQQYKKDGRIVKGVTRGATSFARSTTSEAVRVGASLMMGAQVILERADSFLRPSAPLPSSPRANQDEAGAVSKYAHQPENINEGIEFAYRSLRQNFGAAARTVLAVPVEFTERTGAQGTTRSVIRAIPIVVLQPMIGATQAISMALLGLRNSLDPYRHERLEDKYKSRK